MEINIWITHNGVGSLQSGGLERCRVWFHKPAYVYLDEKHSYDQLPFGGGDVSMGLCDFGWRTSPEYQPNNNEKSSLSLGKWLGYSEDSEISNLVWEKLIEHFKSDDLRQWENQSKKLKLHRSDFLLELKINVTLISHG